MITTAAPPSATAPALKPPRGMSPSAKFGVVLLVLALVAAAAVGGFAVERFFGGTARASDSQIYRSVESKQEVALLALGIQGIARENEEGQILGVRLAAGDRMTLIQYEFTAKVGIDGEDVKLDKGDDESTFVVSIPEFIFIGYDDPHFEDPIESNGPLSFVTEEIEETEMVNSILSDDKQQTYIDDHVQVLRNQARDYYTGVIRSIDPDAHVEFEFAQ